MAGYRGLNCEMLLSRALVRGRRSPRSCRSADRGQFGRKPKRTFRVTADYANMFNHERSKTIAPARYSENKSRKQKTLPQNQLL